LSKALPILIASVLLFSLIKPAPSLSHPLRLSLSEIEYKKDEQLITIDLRLFLMDVNEALVFDPESTELRFCEPDESPNAEALLMNYINDFFYIEINGKRIPLEIKSKRLKGNGIDTALGLVFEYRQSSPLNSMKIKNAVFTDLFFDQNNIVYVYINDNSTSLMLDKNTPTHRLVF
tara:strand:- start:622 stop:1149 length:528 start_codon:yes stop_codon:yes gene_type:complete